jgi:hypothetical protein
LRIAEIVKARLQSGAAWVWWVKGENLLPFSAGFATLPEQ